MHNNGPSFSSVVISKSVMVIATFRTACLTVAVFVTTGSVWAQQTPPDPTSFSCDGRTSGYYADVASGCQVYHMCDGLGRQFTYKCPSSTLFQQRMLICDHWYMVNCSKSEEDYSANLLIGQQDRRFVEELQFHRTPRPDLNEAKRPREDSGEISTEPYFLPSRWSTEISSRPSATTTARPVKRAEPNFLKQTYYKTNYASKEKSSADATGVNAGQSGSVNFPSKFKATTPVYPRHPDIDSSKVQSVARSSQDDGQSSSSVNFRSNFKATTPVYPKHVPTDRNRLSEFDVPIGDDDDDKNDDVVVNFASNFKATTPAFPARVDFDPAKLSEFDLPSNPASLEGAEDTASSPDSPRVNFASNFKATTPVYPKQVDVDLSKFSEPVELPRGIQQQPELANTASNFRSSEPVEVPQTNPYSGNSGVNFASNFKATTPVYPRNVDVDLRKFSEPVELPKVGDPIVNFASKFKATTPVYPPSVDVDLSKFSEPVELPKDPNTAAAQAPLRTDDTVVNFASDFKATTPVYPKQVDVDSSKFYEPIDLPESGNNVIVNFASNFKATTPVYPLHVEATSPIPEQFGLLPPNGNNGSTGSTGNGDANFPSNFQATTPVYPHSVAPTSPDPKEAGIEPPQGGASSFDSAFKRRIDEDDPSVIGNTFTNQQLTEFMVTIKPDQLKNLKTLWHVPEYDFPLETVAGPGYEGVVSSFQASRKGSR